MINKTVIRLHLISNRFKIRSIIIIIQVLVKRYRRTNSHNNVIKIIILHGNNKRNNNNITKLQYSHYNILSNKKQMINKAYNSCV